MLLLWLWFIAHCCCCCWCAFERVQWPHQNGEEKARLGSVGQTWAQLTHWSRDKPRCRSVSGRHQCSVGSAASVQSKCYHWATWLTDLLNSRKGKSQSEICATPGPDHSVALMRWGAVPNQDKSQESVREQNSYSMASVRPLQYVTVTTD